MQREYFINNTNNYIKGAQVYLKKGHFADYNQYKNFYAQCKMTFNSGFRHNKYAILNTRVTETIMNKTLLLEENYPLSKDFYGEISNFYIPYIHYIPVQTRADVIIWAQYMLNNNQWLEKITNEAFEFYNTHYASNNFWSCIENQYYSKQGR